MPGSRPYILYENTPTGSIRLQRIDKSLHARVYVHICYPVVDSKQINPRGINKIAHLIQLLTYLCRNRESLVKFV